MAVRKCIVINKYLHMKHLTMVGAGLLDLTIRIFRFAGFCLKVLLKFSFGVKGCILVIQYFEKLSLPLQHHPFCRLVITVQVDRSQYGFKRILQHSFPEVAPAFLF